MKSSLYPVLANHRFLTLWLAQVLTQISANIAVFILGLRVYALTGSNAAVSALFVAFGIPAVAFSLLAGVYADRFNKKKVLLFTNLIRFLAILLFPFFSDFLWSYYLLAFTIASATQFFAPAEGAIIPALVPKKDLLTANSLYAFTFYSSVALGFLLAGPLLKILGLPRVFEVLALLFLLATVLIIFLPGKVSFAGFWRRILSWPPFRLPNHKDFREIFQETWGAFEYVLREKRVFSAIFFIALTQVTTATLLTLGPDYVTKVLKVSLEDISIFVFGPGIVGFLLGALFLSHLGRRFFKRRLIGLGIILIGISLFLLPFLDGFVTWVGVLLFLSGLGASLVVVPSNTLIQVHSHPKVRGRVYGVLFSLVALGSSLPVPLAGILADIFGVGGVISLVGSLFLAGGILAFRKLP